MLDWYWFVEHRSTEACIGVHGVVWFKNGVSASYSIRQNVHLDNYPVLFLDLFSTEVRVI